MLRIGAAALTTLCACKPGVRPEVVGTSLGEGANWLHDTVRIEFSEPIYPLAGGVRLETSAGIEIPSRVWSGTGPTGHLFVEGADEATASGTIRIIVNDMIEDVDGDAVVPADFEWELEEWSRLRIPVAANELQADPVILATDDRYPFSPMTVLWTRDDPDERFATGRYRVGVEWRTVDDFAGFGDGPIVAAVLSSFIAVLLPERVTYVALNEGSWNGPSESGGLSGVTRLVASTTSELVAAGTATNGAVRVLLQDNGWNLVGGAPIAATSVVGRPAVAMFGDERPIVSFLDVVDGALSLRTLSFGGSVWTEWPREAMGDVSDLAGMVTTDTVAYVAWTEVVDGANHVRIAEIIATGCTVLPDVASVETFSPSIVLGADAQLHASWVEVETGIARMARWSGTAWEPIGAAFTDVEPALSASTSLYAGIVPVATWREEDAIGIALYNGPAE